jgi:phosphoglycolate phosphatase
MVKVDRWFHDKFKQAHVQGLVVPLPHSREFLGWARQKSFRTFLLSSVHRDHWATQSVQSGLGQFIEKPYVNVLDKRNLIDQLLRENHLAPQETTFIGDMQHDVETARHGGVFSVAVLTGYNEQCQLEAARPDLIVEHLGALRQIMEQELPQNIS